MQRGTTKKVTTYGMLISLAFIFSYLESFIPLPNFFIPGMKLGLANIVVLIALYTIGYKGAFILSVVRVLLVNMTFGNMSMFWFALSGAMFSFVVMALMKRCKGFGIVGVSIGGSLAHNFGQILVAMIMLGQRIIYYLLLLLLSGTITGALVGIVGALIYKKLSPALRHIQ